MLSWFNEKSIGKHTYYLTYLSHGLVLSGAIFFSIYHDRPTITRLGVEPGGKMSKLFRDHVLCANDGHAFCHIEYGNGDACTEGKTAPHQTMGYTFSSTRQHNLSTTGLITLTSSTDSLTTEPSLPASSPSINPSPSRLVISITP